jgi:hypothetical protein
MNGLAQGFGQMNPMEAVERELDAYRRFTRQPNLGLPSVANAAPAPDGNAQLGTAIPFLGVAPPDPPFPPAVIIPTENIVHWIRGAIFMASVFLMMVFCQFWRIYLMVGMLYLMSRMYVWGNGAGRFNFEQEMNQQQRLLPAPNAMQHYVVQMAT